MNYKYGYVPKNQLNDYKKRLHSLVHWLLVYAEETPNLLLDYIDKVQLRLNGLNELLLYPTQILEIMNLVESAKIEFLQQEFNFKIYRKLIFDMHELIDRINNEKVEQQC